ncbi:galactosyl transferase GMA12/MNN10 family-domain-containing protein [Clohesyomyces aquaticus]|uniref:Galactosyl transferase GMA12/MNN10 family-domain-containing protein n=1 Tax=Clohesyomyces aquaticus TaxID=1231657 RepID=A0A1Y1YCH2_9PLEO|nr:galactosyl transferase GMA12/MNN10 family-domain-containing protein [Clohesyomyces aquaticus]
MLFRSLRISPSVALFLLFCAFLGWQLSHGPIAGQPIDPPGPGAASPRQTPRIAIVTLITQEKSYIHMSLRNKDHYARRHGYDLVVDYEAHSQRGTTWWKYNMMERLIKTDKYDWMWWIDFDTLITNTDIKIADIIDETLANVTNAHEIDILTSHDCNGLNTGSFVVRSRESAAKYLRYTYDLHAEAKQRGEQYSEQDAMKKLQEIDPLVAKHTVQVPQWKINAFPPEIACFDESKKVWEHGTFVIHFAGAWAHLKDDDPTGLLMRKYEKEIVWGDWEDIY